MTWYELFNLLIDEIYNRELLMNSKSYFNKNKI